MHSPVGAGSWDGARREQPARAARLRTSTVDNRGKAVETCNTGAVPDARFLTLADVAEILAISMSQTYALVRNDELKAIKIGGRGQWRVETTALEEYIQRAYRETAEWVSAHPFVDSGAASED
jgi:excisionase family DNA binding protein